MENIKVQIHEDFEKLKSDKENYFEQFYKNNYNFVYRICFSILKDKENSEDVSQIIFEKIYKMPVENLASSYESSWLYTVAKNESIQFIRRNKFHDSLDESNVVVEDKQNTIEEIERNEDYKKIVNKLNKKQERIVSLKVVSDFTFREIGQMLSMPTATVQWYYYSSIKSLKAAIGSMAMFIISFVLGIKLYKSADDTEKKSKQEVVNKEKMLETSDSASSEFELSEETKNTKHEVLESITNTYETKTEQTVDNFAQSRINTAPIVCFSIAGICLICSIVFGIVFAKRKKRK